MVKCHVNFLVVQRVRIWRCHSCDTGRNCGGGPSPGLEMSTSLRGSQIKKKKKKVKCLNQTRTPSYYCSRIPGIPSEVGREVGITGCRGPSPVGGPALRTVRRGLGSANAQIDAPGQPGRQGSCQNSGVCARDQRASSLLTPDQAGGPVS